MDGTITLKMLLGFCTVISCFIGLITFVLTRWYMTVKLTIKFENDFEKLKDSFRTKLEAIKCVEERELAEQQILQALNDITSELNIINKRLIAGNIIQRKLVEYNKDIPNDEIEKISKDVGLMNEKSG